jgi:hypothetical protein
VRKHYIDYGLHSRILMHDAECGSFCTTVQYARRIKQNIYTLPVFFSLFLSEVKYGVIFQWIS